MASLDPLLFFVMMRLAERLPVVLVPEQRLVAVVRTDVIDNSSQSELPFPFAHDAKRMFAKEG